MLIVSEGDGQWIMEDSSRFPKIHSMLFEIDSSFPAIPCENHKRKYSFLFTTLRYTASTFWRTSLNTP